MDRPAHVMLFENGIIYGMTSASSLEMAHQGWAMEYIGHFLYAGPSKRHIAKKLDKTFGKLFATTVKKVSSDDFAAYTLHATLKKQSFIMENSTERDEW